MDVRILGLGDETVLGRVAAGVFDDAIDLPATRLFLADPWHHLCVAVDEGVVIGFASAVAYLHPDKPRPELWINEVGVAPEHQGRGIGKAILLELLRHAASIGCTEAWVLTDRRNAPAMRLYASAGGLEAPEDQVMFTFPLETQVSVGRLNRQAEGWGDTPDTLARYLEANP